jgi:hypothetical protein
VASSASVIVVRVLSRIVILTVFSITVVARFQARRQCSEAVILTNQDPEA